MKTHLQTQGTVVCGHRTAAAVVELAAWPHVETERRCRSCESRYRAAAEWTDKLGLGRGSVMDAERRALLERVRQLEQTVAELRLELKEERSGFRNYGRLQRGNWSQGLGGVPLKDVLG